MAKKSRNKPKSTLQTLWHFIWNEDSLASWIVNIVLAFVIIKFLVYPGLGLLFGTSYPLVAVISGSMYHGLQDISDDSDVDLYRICGNTYPEKIYSGQNFDNWWEECGDWYEDRNITKNEFKKFPMSDGFAKGDIIVLRNADPENVDVGDIIVFEPVNRATVLINGQRYHVNEPVIHRVIDMQTIDGKVYYTTKGDHNEISGPIDQDIPEDNVLGKAWVRIPYIGYLKVIPFEYMNNIRS